MWGVGAATLVRTYGMANGGSRGRRIPRAFKPDSLASTVSSMFSGCPCLREPQSLASSFSRQKDISTLTLTQRVGEMPV